MLAEAALPEHDLEPEATFYRLRFALDLSDRTAEVVEFQQCRFQGADFSHADLCGTQFVDCDLTGAQFSQATMTGAYFRGCILTGTGGITSFAGARIAGHDPTVLSHILASALGIQIEDDQATDQSRR